MGKYNQTELEVLLYELKADLAAYLAEYAPGSPVKTLADVIAFNEKQKKKEMPYFGQEHSSRPRRKAAWTRRSILDALANNLKLSRAEGIDKVLADNNLDALVAPTGQPAWLTDFIKGDASGGSFTSRPRSPATRTSPCRGIRAGPAVRHLFRGNRVERAAPDRPRLCLRAGLTPPQGADLPENRQHLAIKGQTQYSDLGDSLP